MISPISRMVLGFHVVEAMGVWERRDLEEAMAFGGIRRMNWLMSERVDFLDSFGEMDYFCRMR